MKSIFLTFGVALLVIGLQAQPAAAATSGDSATWEGRYEADVMPSAASPAWTPVDNVQNISTVSNGVLTVNNIGQTGKPSWELIPSPLGAHSAISVEFRVKIDFSTTGTPSQPKPSFGTIMNTTFSAHGINLHDIGTTDTVRYPGASWAGWPGVHNLDASKWHTYRGTFEQIGAGNQWNTYVDFDETPVLVWDDGVIGTLPPASTFLFNGWAAWDSIFQLDYIRWTTAGAFPQVPEPSTVVLLLTGVVGMFLTRRSRKWQVASGEWQQR